jgi:hypothetical protein
VCLSLIGNTGMVKPDRTFRHIKLGNVHHGIRIEMCDELIAISPNRGDIRIKRGIVESQTI